ncbi:uncharacterized protein CDAR_236821 [Caerostris darwini]|uniref:Odorant receptor n=1 Tax=Caerostris darwini TaxID=1538125 RepID=A0AAV4S1K4_9ARAC|nr:uncharacterized protein CDAR_236821 [Caerostris darwini]
MCRHAASHTCGTSRQINECSLMALLTEERQDPHPTTTSIILPVSPGAPNRGDVSLFLSTLAKQELPNPHIHHCTDRLIMDRRSDIYVRFVPYYICFCIADHHDRPEFHRSRNCQNGPIQKKITFLILELLFRLHGIPVPDKKPSLCIKWIFRILRISAISFSNIYVGYRVYKLINQKNVTYDIYPLINAGVSACIVDSVVIYSHKFDKFSSRLCKLLDKYNIYLSSGTIYRLAAFYVCFLVYVMTCAIVFPVHANHWFDAGRRNDTPPDFLHSENIRPCAHIMIFVMCSGNVVSHFMLFCFVCCILQHMLKCLHDDLKARSELDALPEFQSRFIEAASIVKTTDNLFSLFGLVGLGCVFSRACSCIHFYLNMKSPFQDSWIFIIVQITFDFCALTATTGFASSVLEESKKLTPVILQASQEVSVRNIDFHIQCLRFGKVAMSSEIHLSAWKLFPINRKILPTVIGRIRNIPKQFLSERFFLFTSNKWDTNEVSRGQKAIETESDPTDDGCLPTLQDEVLLN